MNFNSVISKKGLKDILCPFFEELHNQEVDYCICGNYENLPDYTSHDVDIWADDPARVEQILSEVARGQGFYLYLANKTASGFNNFYYKNGNDGSIHIIGIDISKECCWYPFIPLVRADRIREERVRYKNIYVAGPVVEACMHFLFPLIHFGKIKEKYKEKIFNHRRNQRFLDIVAEALGVENTRFIADSLENQDWESITGRVAIYRKTLIMNSLRDFGLGQLHDLLNFVWTSVYRIVRPSGLFIAIIGPDGAGKTTVINSLGHFFSEGFLSGKVKRFYWRPYLLPEPKGIKRIFIREKQMPAGRVPLVKNLEDVKVTPIHYILYTLKFIYYIVDLIIGRIKYQNAWSRGGVICFDRYYYDNIVCPQRFGFVMPRRLMWLIERIIPIPDVTFLLYAPVQTLIERKDEFPSEEIERQVSEYDRAISRIQNGHKIDTTMPPDEVEQNIIRICVETMACRINKMPVQDRRLCGWRLLVPGENALLIGQRGMVEHLTRCDRKFGYPETNISTSKMRSGILSLLKMKSFLGEYNKDLIILFISLRLPVFLLNLLFSRAGLEYVYSYMLMPSMDTPRLFLPPLGKLINRSGCILRPKRLKPVLVMNLLRILGWAGLASMFFPEQFIIAKKKRTHPEASGPLIRFLKDILSRDDIDCILYTGASGIYQKFTAQVMDMKGNILAYAKIGHTNEAKERIRNELDTLVYLNSIEFNMLSTPDVIASGVLPGSEDVIIVQSPFSSDKKTFEKDLNDRHVNLLAEIYNKTKKRISSGKYLNNLRNRVELLEDSANAQKSDRISFLIESVEFLMAELHKTELTFGLSHGDFIPWNMYANNLGYFLFDWETSRHRVPLWDLYYFLLFVWTVMHKRGGHDIINIFIGADSLASKYEKIYYEKLENISYYDKNIFLIITMVEIALYYIEYMERQNEFEISAMATTDRLIDNAIVVAEEGQQLFFDRRVK